MQYVILLHGLGRTACSMRRLSKALQSNGYQTFNIDYPSRKDAIETLSEKVIREALQQVPAGATLHFVTHSLGGILLRHYLQNHEINQLGRVVMLGPPNHGSELADWLQRYSLFRWFFGPVLSQLGRTGNRVLMQLSAAHFNLGVISGNLKLFALFVPFVARPNDGIVSVQSTQLEGMHDHICLPVSHTLMMRNKEVIRQVNTFLKHGHFDHIGNHS